MKTRRRRRRSTSALRRTVPLALAVAVAACAPARVTGDAAPAPASTAAAVADDDEAARGEVLAALERYYDDFSARDWQRFADHFHPGAVLASVWQPPGEPAARVVATTVPDFVEQAPAGPGSRAVFEERMTGAELRVHGELAQAWVRYRARFGDPGDIAEWEGIDAFTLLRHDGRWRIVSLAYATTGEGP